MTLMPVDLDPEMLEEAKRLGGHATASEAVAAALEQYIARRQVSRDAVEYYYEVAQDWDIEGAEAAHRTAKEAHRRK